MFTGPQIAACFLSPAYLLAMLAASLSGCAVGGVGTVAANVEHRSAVSTLSVYSVGLHLRTRADDQGVHLGYSKRVYVFAADHQLRPGWHLLSVPSPDHSAIAQDLTTVGIDVSATVPQAGLAIGYAHTRLLARVPLHASVLLGYTGSGLQVDRFQDCKEKEICVIP